METGGRLGRWSRNKEPATALLEEPDYSRAARSSASAWPRAAGVEASVRALEWQFHHRRGPLEKDDERAE